ncbi:MAG: sigma-E processing peptidase SpoIIGA [Candidatus Gastranaerophilales bacterium]|nr:sigma-E processing peptidase SpoIIGA [Candidatus Gastranaerophilales bacterium]
MNLFLLLLVNERTHRTATRFRLILGAAAGAVLFLFPFFCNGPVGPKVILGAICGVCSMLFLSFRVRSVRAFFGLFEKLLRYSFLMGGALLFLIRCLSRIFPAFRDYVTGIFGIIGVGAMVFLFFFYRRETDGAGFCTAVLVCGERRESVSALLDTGNSLTEPISGKPVSVLDKEVFDRLWEQEPAYFRVIPYHSIGRNKGLLKGYLLPELRLELDGVVKICRDVYIAVGEEPVSEENQEKWQKVKLIVNPELLYRV